MRWVSWGVFVWWWTSFGVGSGALRAEGHGSDWLLQTCHPGGLKMAGDLAHLIGGCGALVGLLGRDGGVGVGGWCLCW